MSGRWRGSNRRSRLPAEWPAIRALILERDGHRCRHIIPGYGRCPHPATDVDHVDRGDDHEPENLRAVCAGHHKIKSAQEGRAAQKRATPRAERHPGLR